MTISSINFGCGARPQFGNAATLESATTKADRQFTNGSSAQAITTLEVALGKAKPEDKGAQDAARQLIGYYEIYGQDAEAQETAQKFGIN